MVFNVKSTETTTRLIRDGGEGGEEFSSVQDGICALGKAHMRSILSLGSFPNVPFETVPMFV